MAGQPDVTRDLRRLRRLGALRSQMERVAAYDCARTSRALARAQGESRELRSTVADVSRQARASALSWTEQRAQLSAAFPREKHLETIGVELEQADATARAAHALAVQAREQMQRIADRAQRTHREQETRSTQARLDEAFSIARLRGNPRPF